MSSRRAGWAAGLSVLAVGAIAIAIGAVAATRPAVEVGGTAVPIASHRLTTAPAAPSSAGSAQETSRPRPSMSEAAAQRSPEPRVSTDVTTEPASAAPLTTSVVEPPQTATITVTEKPDPPAIPDESDSAPTETTSSATARPTIELSGDAALYAETESAVAAVEAYWNYIFTGWDVTWHGPLIWAGDGYYDSESAVPGPYCAGEPIELNAAFCGHGVVGEGVVSWDLPLMRMGYETFGDSFVYLVVAHEWGHAAQERFVADGEEPAVLLQQELQADCLAGATLTKAAELGYLQIEPGDIDELIDSLNALGDSHTWTQVDDHGSSDQRVAWFTKGFNGDIESCLGNR